MRILSMHNSENQFAGLRPLPPTPEFRILGSFGKCRFFEFSGGIWGLGGSAIDWKWLWDSNRRILSPNRPSTAISSRMSAYGSIFKDFLDFGHFGIVVGGLTLLPEGPRTLRECPEVPGPYESVLPNWSGLVWTSRDLSRLVGTCPDLSQLVQTCPDLSRLVATCRNLSELLWP